MAKLTWDAIGEHIYETGVSKGVLYKNDAEADKQYSKGYAWNGLTSVSESPSGAESTALYADNIKYLNMLSAEEFGGTIEAYTYPEAFAECDGSILIAPGVTIGQQARVPFGLSYQTVVGNDTVGEAFGYKIHLVYGCLASPSDRSYSTINDSPEAITFSWEFSTTPVNVEGAKATSLVTIDSTKFTTEADKAKLKALEDILYGTETEEPRLPLPDEIKTMFAASGASF